MKILLKPVSINAAYRGGRRFKTKDYLAFEKAMLLQLKGIKQLAEKEYGIRFRFYLKNALACDVSNFIKTTEDCIVKAGLVRDDRFCMSLTAEKYKSKTDYLEFEIWEVFDEKNIADASDL